MPLDPDILTRSVHIEMVDNLGAPRQGSLTFINTRVASGEQSIPPDDIVATLNGTGEATVTLIANLNNPGISPNGSYWTVIEQLDGGYSKLRYIQVDYDDPSEPVEYASLVDATPEATALAYVTQSELIQAVNNAVGGGGAVTSVAGRTGAVVLAAADIASGTFLAARLPGATTGAIGAVQLTGALGGTATAPTTPTAMHLTGAETVAGAKTFTDELTVTSNTVANQGLVIQRTGAVTTTDGELLLVTYNGDPITLLNEKGNPRFRRGPGSSEVIVKHFVDGNSTHDIAQYFLVGDTTTPSARIGGGGGLFFPSLTTTGNVTAGGTVLATNTPSELSAADYGYQAWNFPGYQSPGGTLLSSGSAAGTVVVIRIPIRTARTISSISVYQTAAGSGLTSGQCFAGLFDSSRVLLATSADQSTAWGSGSGVIKTASITPQAVSAGHVYAGFFYNGTTAPSWARCINNGVVNLGRTGNDAMFATADTGRTTSFPTPLATLDPLSVGFWVGLG